LKQQSGFKQDELSGADIRPKSQAIWDDYVIVSSQIHCPLHHTNSYEEKSKSNSILEKGMDSLSSYLDSSTNEAQWLECISPRSANNIGGKQCHTLELLPEHLHGFYNLLLHLII
jgi:hypothetical protein